MLESYSNPRKTRKLLIFGLGFSVDVVRVRVCFAYVGFSFMTSSPRQRADIMEKCQFLRFDLHPYKLAKLRVTIGLIITSCYRIKFIKIKGFVTSQ